MVSIGKPSSSAPSSGKKTSTKEIVTVFGGIVGIATLLSVGVTGIILALPEPETSSNRDPIKMIGHEEAAKAAHERLKKAKKEALQKNKDYKKIVRPPKMKSSDQAAKEARARRLAIAGAENVKSKDERCEEERSFLIDLLTDRQFYEFMKYLEQMEGNGGDYNLPEFFSAETLKKDSCCCGATAEDPCACMIEGVMDCSYVEPKCPCYAAENSEDYEIIMSELRHSMERDGETIVFGDVVFGLPNNRRARISSYGQGADKNSARQALIDRATDYLQEEEEFNVEEYAPDEMIPIGTKVRSYDFWPHDKTCYKEGVIIDHAPSPSCSPRCMHYHIRTTKVVRRGKSRPVEEGEIFMTHPYADLWDQEYPGQLAQHIHIISDAFPSTSAQ